MNGSSAFFTPKPVLLSNKQEGKRNCRRCGDIFHCQFRELKRDFQADLCISSKRGCNNELLSSISKFNIEVVERPVSFDSSCFKKRAPTAPESGLCEVCHLLVGQVQDLLTTGQTQTAIRSYIQDACSKLPTEEKDVCNSFVKDYSDDLFSRLIKDLTPFDFCEKLTDVCPAYHEKPEIQLLEEADDIAANPLECELCKLSVLGIDKLIKENRSSAAINDTLEKFCNGLPDQLKDVCIKVEPAILKGLTTGFEPKVACKFARLCSAEGNDYTQIPCDVCYTVMDAIGVSDSESICASQASCIKESEAQRKQDEAQPEIQDTLECQICKFAVQAVDTLVGENRTIAAINSTLMKLCNSLPGELKDSCLNVEPDILKAVIGGIDPSKACDFLKICNDESKVPVSSLYISCDVCRETLEAVAGEKGVQQCFRFKDVCGLEEVPEAERVEQSRETFLTEENEKETITEDAKCELCKFMIQLLDETLKTNSTEEKINTTLFEICNALPDTFKLTCLAIVPQIETAAAAGLDPTNTCIASNFCTPSSRLVSIEELKCELCASVVESLPDSEALKVKRGVCNNACRTRSRRSADQETPLRFKLQTMIQQGDLKGVTECELCHVFIRTLDGLAGENASIETVNKTVIEICQRLTGIQLQQICLQEAPVLVQILKKGLDPVKVCKDAKLCTEVKVKRRSVEEKKVEDEKEVEKKHSDSALMNILISKQGMENKVGDLQCDICEGVVELLDKLLEDNATDEKINQTLYQLCSGLPDGALKDLCLQEAPVIMNAVEQGFDPQKTCELAGLCSGIQRSRKMKSRKLFKHVLETSPADDTSLQNTEESTESLENDGNLKDLKCDVCKAVIEEIDAVIKENATIDKINATVYDLCSKLQGALQDLCLQAAPQIVDALKNGVDPSEACSAIGLCSSVQDDVVDKRVDGDVNDDVGDAKCDICELIIQGLDEIIGKNSSAQKINETIYTLCNDLSGSAKSFCLLLAPTVVQEIEGGVDPQKACEALKLCTSADQTTVVKENVGDVKCDICQLIIQELDSIVGQNASEEKINATIFNLCNNLPGSAKSYCLLVAPVIVKEIEGGVDPEKACETLKLCTSLEIPESIRENVGDIKCDICELIIQELDSIVGQNASDEKINATIYNLCNYLSGTAKSFCLLVAPTIVKEIESGVDPEKACEALKLCTSRDIVLSGPPTNVRDLKCELCELIVRKVDEGLGKNASKAEINSTIYKICDDLSGTAKTYCLLLAPAVVKALEDGVQDPEAVCKKLKLCINEGSESNIIIEERKDPLDCNICKKSLEAMYDDVSGNYMKVQRNLLELCSNLPVVFRNSCEKLILNDHGRVYKMVMTKYTPTSLCEMAKCQEHWGLVKNNSS